MTAMGGFNVLTAPWIPVEGLDGARDELGILAVLRKAPELASIRDPSPIVEFGLYRLVVAFVLDALVDAGRAPTHLHDLRDLLAEGAFDMDQFERYAENCGDVFDLFHPERPFLQCASAAGGEKPIAAMFPAVSSGTNVGLWQHAHEDSIGVTVPEAARLLTTIAPFMTAGGAGLSPSINGSPAIYALPLGESLFETLVLNLPIDLRDTGGGRVAWRDSRVPGGERTRATTVEALTWRPRRVRLIRSSDDGAARVKRIYFQAGDSTRLVWKDPNLAYRYDGEGQSPVRMREGRPFWRDAGPLALLNRDSYRSGDDKYSYGRPDVVETAFRVLERPLRIRAYGMRTDLKMKVFEWAVGELDVPTEVGRDARVGVQIQRWMDQTETVGRSLRFALRSLYPREGAGNKNALGRTIEQAERRFWTDLELQFDSLLRRCAKLNESDLEEPDRIAPVVQPWRDAVRWAAFNAFDVAADAFAGDADTIERAVKARDRLSAAIWRKQQ